MSYASDLGLKVGDKIKYTCKGEVLHSHRSFRIGDVLMLTRYDGSSIPFFKREGDIEDKEHDFDLSRRGWVKVEQETNMNKAIERDKEYDVKLTGEEIALCYLLLGKSNGTLGQPLYTKLGQLLRFNKQVVTYDVLESIDVNSNIIKINNWLDKVFEPQETEEQRNLRELKEQYEILGNKIKQMEK
jgi:hypothetical protein